MISVTAIGSCRVHNPMRAAHAENWIKLNRSGFREFTHAPRETLQKLRIADGRMVVPSHLTELTFGPECEVILRGTPRNSDLALVEISSVRRLTFQGVELQFNFVMEWAKRNGLEDWLVLLSKKARAAELGTAVSVAATHADELVTEIANGVKMSMETDDIIASVMQKIVGDVRIPVIFVGHFNSPNADGSVVEDRQRLNDCLKRTSLELGTGYIDPNDLIQLATPSVALRDSNHWNYDFEREAGNFFYSKISTFISNLPNSK